MQLQTQVTSHFLLPFLRIESIGDDEGEDVGGIMEVAVAVAMEVGVVSDVCVRGIVAVVDEVCVGDGVVSGLHNVIFCTNPPASTSS